MPNKGFKDFKVWCVIEVHDAESMSKKEWEEWLEEQRKALGKHVAKALHLKRAAITFGHLERI